MHVGVLELEELDAPLDVAQPAVPELEVGLAVGAARQALGLHPGLEGADLADLPGVDPALGPAQRVDELDEGGPELRVTGHGRRAQQRLGLPDEGPPLVVGAVGVERARQRTVLALGAQAGVDLEPRVGGRQGEQPDELLDDLERLLLRGARVGTGDGVVDEEHVGVAAERGLPPPEPAHADDEVAAERRRTRSAPRRRRGRPRG